MAARAVSPRHRGLYMNHATGKMEVLFNGTKVADLDANDLTAAVATVLPAAVTINGVAYTWPAADGSSTNQLTTAGNGTLAWLPADDGAA